MSRTHPNIPYSDDTKAILHMRQFWFWQYAFKLIDVEFHAYMMPVPRPPSGGLFKTLSESYLIRARKDIENLCQSNPDKMYWLYEQVDRETQNLWPLRHEFLAETFWDSPLRATDRLREDKNEKK